MMKLALHRLPLASTLRKLHCLLRLLGDRLKEREDTRSTRQKVEVQLSCSHRDRLAVLMIYAILVAEGTSSIARATSITFAPELLDVHRLAMHRPVSRVGAFSSYDRTGGNDDGDSPRWLRKEHGGLVIAELTGKGAITRIWTPTPIDSPTEFYFDGETRPRLVVSFKNIFSGNTEPFVGPLVGHELGGYYSYVPIEFDKSIKIIVHGDSLQFYMVNYVIYDSSAANRTVSTNAVPKLRGLNADGHKSTRDQLLPAGGRIVIFDSHTPGRIQSMRLSPAQAFVGGDRDIVLRIYWDGEDRPAVEVPAGDFFGYSFGKPAMHSIVLGTEGDSNYVLYPMPFSRSARVELVSERRTGEPLHVRSEVVFSDVGRMPGEGLFHAVWRRENPTEIGRPFTFLEARGAGQIVGVVLQAQGPSDGGTPFFEGDDEVVIDGNETVHGTGSEDSFNGGFYGLPGRWDHRASLPFSGCLGYDREISRTGGYRIFVGDAYTFNHSIQYTIEHSAEGNDIPTDYVSTTYYYLDRAASASAPLPNVAARAVVQPREFTLVFDTGTARVAGMLRVSLVPQITKETGQWQTFLALLPNDSILLSVPRQFQPSILHLPGRACTARQINDYESVLGPPTVVFDVQVPSTGKYKISVDGITGPSRGVLQLRNHDSPAGPRVDFFARKRGLVSGQNLGELALSEGQNPIYLSVPAKNSQSAGGEVDLVRINGIRVD
jgi:hypothetical protein